MVRGQRVGEKLETSRVRPAPEGHLHRDGHDGRGLEAGPDLPWPARRREPAGRLVRTRGPCGRRDPADRPEWGGRPDGGERAVRAGRDRNGVPSGTAGGGDRGGETAGGVSRPRAWHDQGTIASCPG